MRKLKPLLKVVTALWGIGWVILPVQNIDAQQQPCIQKEWVGNGN